MKCSLKSWHAKLWLLTYGKNKGLPNNLCPYFWSVICAAIMLIPLSMFFIPLAIADYLIRKFDKDNERAVFEDGYCSWIFFMGLIINATGVTVFSMVFMWFQKWHYVNGELKMTVWQTWGAVGYLISFVVVIVLVSEYIKRRRAERRKFKKTIPEYTEAEPNIFTEFVKAKYKRYCPKIDWKS